jgi:transcriptional regulator with XRE-family HTH domain
MTVSTRLKNIREKLEMSQLKFAQKLNSNREYISAVECGRFAPSLEFLALLKTTYKVNIDWVITGDGQMFLPKTSIFDDINSTTEQNETHVNPNLEDHVKLISQLKKALYKAEKNVESAFKELEGVVGLIEAQEQDLSRR